MDNPRLGLELVGLGIERKLFAREGFTTSYVRVAEHIYRALLFLAPEEWELQLFASNRWHHKEGEEGSFRKHLGQVHTLFRPPSLPLIDRWVTQPWREWLRRRHYIPRARSEKLSVMQFTSEWPWGSSPIAEREIALAADFFPERISASSARDTAERFKKRRESTWVIAISEFTRQDAVSVVQIPAGRVKALPLAVDHGIYRPDEQEADSETRRRLAMPENYVLYVGSLSERKNVITLVRAMEAFNSRRSSSEPVTLILAGNVAAANFRQRHQVWSQIRALLKQTPIRQVAYPTDAEMAALYRGAQVVAHPSVFEGFGFTVLEALACGTPVICGRHSSLVEVGGPAARFVEDVRNVEEFAAALDEVIGSSALRQSMRSRGIAHAAGFRWDIFEKQVVEFYGRVLSGRDL